MLDLTDEETAALARLLSRTIDDDRYPLSPRIQNLKGILAKIRPEPVREPLPPLKVYAPPRLGAPWCPVDCAPFDRVCRGLNLNFAKSMRRKIDG